MGKAKANTELNHKDMENTEIKAEKMREIKAPNCISPTSNGALR